MVPGLLVAAVLATLTLGPGVAHAAGPTQDALCDGYGGSGGCRVSTDGDTINLGRRVNPTAWGNPGVDVTVMVYLVEFNSAGAITDLVPASAPARGRTRAVGAGQGVANDQTMQLVPYQPDGFPSGGWLFLGLADDTGLDLTKRIGQLIEYGGDTLRLMGDGYAAQKPVGTTLSLDVIGQVPGMKYWVEYRDESGRWVPVPGQGFHDAQRLSGPPSQRRQLSYVVPDTLTQGKNYQFRVNTELNYGGSPDLPVAHPAFVEWTVIPSTTPVSQGRGKDFDATLAPGKPDPTPGPGRPDPNPGPGTRPTGQPTSQPTSRPAAKPSRQPSATQSAQSAGRPTASATAGVGAPTGASPSPAPSNTAAPTAKPSPTVDPQALTGTAAGSVWGKEAPAADPGTAALPASPKVARTVALLGLVLVLAPALWWALARRRDRRDPGETL